MIVKNIELKNKKSITIIDNILPRASIEGLYAACAMSNYGLIGASNLDIQDMQNRKMICYINDEFLHKNNFLIPEVQKVLMEQLKDTPVAFKS